MSGSLSALFLQNPELANAIRKREQGAALMQQGTDASPVRHWAQGLSRLASALVGGYQQGQADREIKGIGERDNAEVGDFLKRAMGGGMATPQAAVAPRAPAAAATPQAAPVPRPGSPDLIGLVTPIAQKYGVPLNLALGLFQQESGGNPNAVGDGGQSVGLGQIQARTAADPGYGVAPLDPNLRTDPAANVDFALRYLVAKGRHLGATDLTNPAHQDIALRAYNGGGDPNYVQNVRRQMPGDTIPVSTPALPPDAQPVAEPQAAGMPQGVDYRALALEAANSRNPRLQALAPLLMQMATGESKTVNVAPGAQLLDPRTGRVLHTNTTSPVTSQTTIDMKTQGAFDVERGKTLEKRLAEWEEAGGKASSTLSQLRRIESFLDNFTTGAGSQTQITLGQLADRLNVPEETRKLLGIQGDKIAQGEAIRAEAARMLVGMIGAGGFPAQGFSNADREMLERAMPGLQNSPEGNRIIIKAMRAAAEKSMEINRAWRDFVKENGGKPTQGLIEEFQARVLPGIQERDVAVPLLQQGGWMDAPAAQGVPAPMPSVGEVRSGYRFKGGDPNSEQSWEAVR